MCILQSLNKVISTDQSTCVTSEHLCFFALTFRIFLQLPVFESLNRPEDLDPVAKLNHVAASQHAVTTSYQGRHSFFIFPLRLLTCQRVYMFSSHVFSHKKGPSHEATATLSSSGVKKTCSVISTSLVSVT